jgi:hypothetical protein
MLKCQDCGNTERFDVGATEYHRWLIDGNGDYIENIDTGDTKMGDDYKCVQCDSWNVKEEEE